VLWIAGDWKRDVPGLFDYRSATVGDGLLLPALAACLVAGIRALPASPAATRPRRLRASIVGATLAGAALGAGTQALWLLDASPRLNWTLPRPHAFSVAGWYHAAFITLACGTFAGLAMAWVRRTRAAARSSGFGVASGAGSVGLIAHGLQAPPGVAAISVMTLLFIGAAVTEPFRPPRRTVEEVAPTASRDAEAGAAVNITLGSLDFLAFTLVRRRFGGLGAFERAARSDPAVTSQQAGPHGRGRSRCSRQPTRTRTKRVEQLNSKRRDSLRRHIYWQYAVTAFLVAAAFA
jgi:hypothetical protein